MEQAESGQGGGFYPHYDEHRYCTALRSIDTVRALHQTVVSLRSALDESKREIEKLKKQIIVNSEIQDGRQCPHLSNNPNTTVDYQTLGDKVSELERIYFKAHPSSQEEAKEEETLLKNDAKKSSSITNLSIVPNITVSTQNLATNETTSATSGNMASRIDVKIKVSSNINVESNDTTSEHSDSPSSDTKEDDNKGQEERDDDNSKVDDVEETFADNKSNTYTVDGRNVKICVTSEECVNITRKSNSINATSTEYLNLDIDELSEGENSVFTEGATTPIEQRMQQVEDVGSEDEEVAVGEDGELPREEKEENEDIPEEVDDIELIFSADDNKEAMQDDLVSLSEYEPWQESSDGTPILTKFATLTSDDLEREAYYERKRALKAARTKENREQSLDSTNNSISFDNAQNKFQSFDKESENTTTVTNMSRESCSGSYSVTKAKLKNRYDEGNLIETDISKVGMGDENILDMGRRNTCPNPPLYRPLSGRSSFRSPLLYSRYPRSTGRGGYCTYSQVKPLTDSNKINSGKCTSAAQTDISALPHQWRSETQLLSGVDYNSNGFTLPSKSKFDTPRVTPSTRLGKNSLRLSEKTQEARRILLSDINFTSMVPELSRSADHLCQQKINEEADENESDYYKGNNLKAPDEFGRGITPSSSMVASPGVSQWTVNESTTQTERFWNPNGDSFDSTKSFSLRNSSNHLLNRHNRSKSVPSIRCAICKQNHPTIKPSESMMNYSQKSVTFHEPMQKIRGSLPDLRHDCYCPRRYCGRNAAIYRLHESSGSTDSLLDEAEEFLRHDSSSGNLTKRASRRCSEADVQRDFHPSKHSLPFLPKTPKCLKIGQLAKVIAKSGRVVVGKIRYCGPVACADDIDETFVGLQLPSALGDCDGSFGGKKLFECDDNFGMFVPFKKVIMAWNSS